MAFPDIALSDPGGGFSINLSPTGGTYVNVSDSGAGVDSITNISVQAALTDSASGSDSLTSLLCLLSLSDAGSASEIVSTSATSFLTISDSGSATEAISILISNIVSLADSGSGTDIIASILASIAASDAATGADIVAEVLAFLSVYDSATANEVANILAEGSMSDAGAGSDAVSIVAMASLDDSGTGTELISLLIQNPVSDSGFGVDSVFISDLSSPYKDVADSGEGADWVYITRLHATKGYPKPIDRRDLFEMLRWSLPAAWPEAGKVEPPDEIKFDGLLAYADGTNWDPGSGAGYYRWDDGSSTWVILGGSGGTGNYVANNGRAPSIEVRNLDQNGFPSSPAQYDIVIGSDTNEAYQYNGTSWDTLIAKDCEMPFIDLTDVPVSYSGQSGKVVRVNSTENGLEFANVGGATYFTDLDDVPGSYTGQATYMVRVKTDASGLEFVDAAGFIPYVVKPVRDYATQPDKTPEAGDRWIVSYMTDYEDWLGHGGEIAEYTGSTWKFTDAFYGLMCFNNLAYSGTAKLLWNYNAGAGGEGWAEFTPTPKAHHTSHESGGSDAVKLDDLATPDDNTDLNATTSRHGLLPKLSGSTTEFLRGDGAWATISGGGSTYFTDLLDTPSNYTGSAGYIVRVNSTPNGLEFVSPSDLIVGGLVAPWTNETTGSDSAFAGYEIPSYKESRNAWVAEDYSASPPDSIRHFYPIERGGMLPTIVAMQNSPPALPINGDMYIVTATAQYEWTGYEDYLAICDDDEVDGYFFVPPALGMLVFNSNDGYFYVYNGSAWQELTNYLGTGEPAYDILAFKLRGTSHFEAWHTIPTTATSTLTNASITANILYAYPLPCPRAINIDRLAIYVYGAAIGEYVRLGIYEADAYHYPNSLLWDEEFDVSTTGAKSATVDIDLEGGKLYYLVIVSSGTPSLRCFTANTCLTGLQLGYTTPSATQPTLGFYVSFSYTDLPSTFPSGTPTTMTSGPQFAMWFRLT